MSQKSSSPQSDITQLSDYDLSQLFSPAYDTLKFWTGVGSSQTPNNEYLLMARLSAYMGQLGWVGRTGGADGADAAVESPFIDRRGLDSSKIHSYLPWPGFNQRTDVLGWINTLDLDHYEQAVAWARKVHPIYDRLGQGAQKLHNRNIYQVLGNDLQTPSRLLICYAKPRGQRQVEGGTNTAYQVAIHHNIPIINLFLDDHCQIVENVMANLFATSRSITSPET